MTLSQDASAPAQPLGTRLVSAPGRPLAGAIAVFLGGYLMLLSLTGRLTTVAQNVFATALDRGVQTIEPPLTALYVLQFVFAIGVVVAGLFLSGQRSRATVGSVVVVVVAVITLVLIGGLISGAIPFPPREAGGILRAFIANPWFGTVASVGIAWLLTRQAGARSIAILAALVLVPLPTMLAFQNVDFATTSLVLFAVSALVGVAVIAAGRPLRD